MVIKLNDLPILIDKVLGEVPSDCSVSLLLQPLEQVVCCGPNDVDFTEDWEFDIVGLLR